MKILSADQGIAWGSDVQSLSVPDYLKERMPTGVEWVDKGLGGEGFTPSTVGMFIGEPGTGKTTMLLMMASGLADAGHIVVYNTAEESLFQLKNTVDRLGLTGRFKVGAETNTEQLLKNMNVLEAKNPGKRVILFVDSLQCMDDGYFTTGRITSATSTRVLEQLACWAKGHDCEGKRVRNVVAIGQTTKSGKFAGSQQLKHMIDVMMELQMERKNQDLIGTRRFLVSKNRFGGQAGMVWLAIKRDGFTVMAHEGDDEELE